MSTRVLVTGAAGFIGSAVAARLAAQGYIVTGSDNFNAYYSIALKHERVSALLAPACVECRPVDLASEVAVRALFDEVRPDLVVHLAAQPGVRYSLLDPQAYIQSNVVAFGHVLEACRLHHVAHLVYASSSSVYGESAKLPFCETDATDAPVSLYAATKKSNEIMAHSYSRLYDLPITGLRFFTVYGPWGRPDMAYFSFTEKMLRGEAITLYSEGKLRRDFTYIDDIVEGLVRLLHKPPPIATGKVRHEIYNIGNHQPVTMLEFVRTLERVLDLRACVQFEPMQAGDVPATYASIDKLRDWVGFVPSTQLEDGLLSFYEWLLRWHSRLNQYQCLKMRA